MSRGFSTPKRTIELRETAAHCGFLVIPSLPTSPQNHDAMAVPSNLDDARNKLEDLSGIVLKPGENPYSAFINACNDDPVCIYAEPRSAYDMCFHEFMSDND